MRNKNIDIVRTIALLLVIVYHSWVLTGAVNINNVLVRNFITLGGEIGVVAFFMISGYGVYNLCQRLDEKGELSFIPFIKKRILRVAPEYYISLILLLSLTNMAVYVSKEGLDDILLHMCFLHNLKPDTAGSISGVLWTMALTVQFYLFAPVLYKAVKKSAIVSTVLAIGLTIGSKYLFFHVWGGDIPNANNFWLSRQLYTSVVDNFVLGMFVAKIANIRQQKMSNFIVYIGGTVIGLATMYVVMVYGLRNGIHTDNISGYIWHSALAICIGFGMYNFSKLELKENFILRILLYISKHEYGIYVIHLVVIQTMLTYSQLTQNICGVNLWITIIWLLTVAVTVGILFSIMCNCVRINCFKTKENR